MTVEERGGLGVGGGGRNHQLALRKLLGVMDVYMIFTVMMVLRVYACPN